ncbi:MULTISPECIES: hypothetical protein [Streptomyces]|uniref:Lipoprotein n=1 Tax=Streptomyces stelliscabiei TaxID=146820 RepID=A0A8I0P453_9ACTN|nr:MULTISPECIES: hypothetical protein [Streptomyces]KND46085.1 lipoprotein [Streptomyces stelliscabiei]MBE1599336.1 hypothetical protein [Streptomyces stelliscabiei]MDX2520226.1 hypothetical protein [Streptomyces stelliscabiei]SOD75462.1 hypothetical protein SAMN06272781_3267 [Streptomyces sp. 1222.2]
MYRTKAAVAVTLAGVLLAGCSSDGDGGGSGTGQGDKGAGTKAPSPAELTVPPAYEGAKGWDQELDWVPESTESDMPVTTDGQTVAYVTRSSDGYAVEARDIATGKVRWRGAPYQVPTVINDQPSYGYNEDNREIPQVTVVRQSGRTFVAAWAHGRQDGDALTKSQEVVQVDLYAMDASGTSVAPLHRVAVPVTARGDTLKVYDGGAELVVTWEEYSDRLSVSIDGATGKLTEYDPVDVQIPKCHSICTGSEVVGVAPDAPVAVHALGGFGLVNGWSSQDVAPKDADSGRKTHSGGYVSGGIAAVGDGVFLAHWKGADDLDATVWSAHDLDTGRLLASTTCGEGGTAGVTNAVASPNGRYLALDSVVLDVKSGTGLCLQGDDNRRTIGIRALTDGGVAYGETDVESGAKPVIELKVSDGKPEVLTDGTYLPAAILKKAALFTLRENGSGLLISVRQER